MASVVIRAVTMAAKGSVTPENGLYLSYALFLVV